MVKALLEGKYVSLRPSTIVGVGVGFNFETSVWRWDMSQVEERL